LRKSRGVIMRFLNFTSQEIKVLILLLTTLVVGSGITLYKRTHPQFAPELVVEKREVNSPSQALDSSHHEPKEKKIDINQATATQLQLLPGVGPVLSKRIIKYRESQGRFKRIEDLMQVQGIGPKTFQQIKDLLTVDEEVRGEKHEDNLR
jgi:comEA protein